MQSKLARVFVFRSFSWFIFIIAAVLCGIAAIWPSSSVRKELVVILDRSASVQGNGETLAPGWIQELGKQADVVYTIHAGEESYVVGGLDALQNSSRNLRGFSASETDYEQALQLAASLPRVGQIQRRILLVGDGRETKGAGEAEAKRQADELLIETVAIGRRPAPDGRAISLLMPPTVYVGAQVTLFLFAESTEEMLAQIFLSDVSGKTLAQTSARLTPGGMRIPLPASFSKPGLCEVRVRVQVAKDIEPANNDVSGVVRVLAASEVLWVDPMPPAKSLARNLNVVHVRPGLLNPATLHRYRSLILHNVDRANLAAGIGRTLEDAVRDGLGVLVFGEKTRGFAKAVDGDLPLEALLPVRMTPHEKLAVVMALDCSGSMNDSFAGLAEMGRKIDLTVTAVAQAWEHLVEGDRGGVVTFTNMATVRFPLTHLVRNGVADESFENMQKALENLQPRGGTSVFAGITKTLDLLDTARAKYYHGLIITDGDTEEKDEILEQAIKRLATRLKLYQNRVRLSIIAVGDSPNKKLMARLDAMLAIKTLSVSGRLFELPSILQERIVAERPLIKKDARIGKIGRHELIRKLVTEKQRTVRQYLAPGPAREKQGAKVLLRSTQGEALLALWRRGLGRVAVLAGSPVQGWGWNKTGEELVRRLIGWCATGESAHQVRASTRDGRLHISFALTELEARSSLVDKDTLQPMVRIDGQDAFSLLPESSGVWIGEGAALKGGIHLIEVVAQKSGILLAETPYLYERRQERLHFGVDGAALQRIAHAGGGELVHGLEQCASWKPVPVAGGEPGRETSLLLLIVGLLLLLFGLLLSAWR